MELEEVCLGRVMMRLPVDREVASASGRIDDVVVEEIPGGSHRPLAALRELEIDTLAKITRSDASPVASEQTGADVWIARYKTRPGRAVANAVHGIAIVDGVALRLNALGDEAVIDEVAAAVSRVAQGIAPLASLSQVPHDAFCLPTRHVVAQPYQGFNEAVSVRYRLPDGDMLDVELHANSDTVPDRLPQSLGNGSLDLQRSVGMSLEYAPVAQVHSRIYDGDAAQVGGDAPGEFVIWRAPGSHRDPARPFIEITLRGSTSLGERIVTLAAIVGSLRPVGGGR